MLCQRKSLFDSNVKHQKGSEHSVHFNWCWYGLQQYNTPLHATASYNSTSKDPNYHLNPNCYSAFDTFSEGSQSKCCVFLKKKNNACVFQGLTLWLVPLWDSPFWSAPKSSSTTLTSGSWMAPWEFSLDSSFWHMAWSKRESDSSPL